MNRGSTKKQRLEGQQHYDELESDIDKKQVRNSIHQLIRAIQWRITCGRWE